MGRDDKLTRKVFSVGEKTKSIMIVRNLDFSNWLAPFSSFGNSLDHLENFEIFSPLRKALAPGCGTCFETFHTLFCGIASALDLGQLLDSEV